MKINSKGFTLIELLVVIAIIGTLSTVIFTSLSSTRMKARDVRRLADVKQIQLALAFFYSSNNSYPSIGCNNCGINWSLLQTPLAPYISVISPDPLGSTWHTVQYVRGPVTNNSYGIWIRREQTGYCKIGVNIDPAWWGIAVPFCQ